MPVHSMRGTAQGVYNRACHRPSMRKHDTCLPPALASIESYGIHLSLLPARIKMGEKLSVLKCGQATVVTGYRDEVYHRQSHEQCCGTSTAICAVTEQ